MPFPPNLDPDDLQELAYWLDDHARELDREVQDLRKRAKACRAAATKIKGLDHSSTLGHSDEEEDEQ